MDLPSLDDSHDVDVDVEVNGVDVDRTTGGGGAAVDDSGISLDAEIEGLVVDSKPRLLNGGVVVGGGDGVQDVDDEDDGTRQKRLRKEWGFMSDPLEEGLGEVVV